jgi:hypothetical protein
MHSLQSFRFRKGMTSSGPHREQLSEGYCNLFDCLPVSAPCRINRQTAPSLFCAEPA